MVDYEALTSVVQMEHVFIFFYQTTPTLFISGQHIVVPTLILRAPHKTTIRTHWLRLNLNNYKN